MSGQSWQPAVVDEKERRRQKREWKRREKFLARLWRDVDRARRRFCDGVAVASDASDYLVPAVRALQSAADADWLEDLIGSEAAEDLVAVLDRLRNILDDSADIVSNAAKVCDALKALDPRTGPQMEQFDPRDGLMDRAFDLVEPIIDTMVVNKAASIAVGGAVVIGGGGGIAAAVINSGDDGNGAATAVPTATVAVNIATATPTTVLIGSAGDEPTAMPRPTAEPATPTPWPTVPRPTAGPTRQPPPTPTPVTPTPITPTITQPPPAPTDTPVPPPFVFAAQQGRLHTTYDSGSMSPVYGKASSVMVVFSNRLGSDVDASDFEVRTRPDSPAPGTVIAPAMSTPVSVEVRDNRVFLNLTGDLTRITSVDVRVVGTVSDAFDQQSPVGPVTIPGIWVTGPGNNFRKVGRTANMTVIAGGFNSGERVSLTARDGGVLKLLGDSVANATGNVSTTVDAPFSVGGPYEVVATGEDGLELIGTFNVVID